MKIYTRSGDDGTTGMFGGGRVSKSDARIDCIGCVDEVNAALGWAGAVANDALARQLREIQGELFVIGSLLSSTSSAVPLPQLEQDMIKRLEQEIDLAEAQIPALKNFILPGGTELAARLHLSRTICRRAERRLVEHSHQASVLPILLSYLNRLSDWLF